MVAISFLSHFVTLYLFASSSSSSSSSSKHSSKAPSSSTNNRKRRSRNNRNNDSTARRKSNTSRSGGNVMKHEHEHEHEHENNHKYKKQRTGRRRYSRAGDKIKTGINTNANTNTNTNNSNYISTTATTSSTKKTQEDVYPLPSLTKKDSNRQRRLIYLTCRHTYEDTLIHEVKRYVEKEKKKKEEEEEEKKKKSGEKLTNKLISAISPYPGLVKVDFDFDYHIDNENDNDDDRDFGHDCNGILSHVYDPVYALQTMPDCVVVSGDSIKNIANEIYESLLGSDDDDVDNDHDNGDNDGDNDVITCTNKSFTALQRKQLQSAPRGSLAIHSLVPGMCKGQTKPIMLHRCEKVGEELAKRLRKRYPAARRKGTKKGDGVGLEKEGEGEQEQEEEEEKWLLQFMLQSNTIAVASLTKCTFVGPGKGAYWPNWDYPLGLVDASIEEKMPSSAYRKLSEGMECMKRYPDERSTVVDLGACPGGWTAVMRRFGSAVTAVDRSKLDPVLMKDDMVTFVKGDAFAFVPKSDDNDNDNGNDNGNDSSDDTWMVSDIIAYPERCTELLNKWCSKELANHMIVTMKFQGDEPDWDELDTAIDVVESHGYGCRVKHFFNNKNEVTFMVWKRREMNIQDDGDSRSSSSPAIGKSMYRRI